MALNESNFRTKSSLPDMELIAEEQAIAIGRLENKLKKIEEQNEVLREKLKLCEEDCSLKEAEYIKNYIASGIRLAQAEFLLPCKRPRLSSQSGADSGKEDVLSEYESPDIIHPALDFIYQKAQELIKSVKSEQQQSYDDLLAWKFTPDSASGRRLMTCFRQLLEKNEGLGAINENDSLSKLESETQVQDSCIRECLKTAQDFNAALLESTVDLDGVQNSLFALKNKLNKAENLIATLKAEYEKVNPNQSDALIAAALATLSQQAMNPQEEEEVQGEEAAE
nr:Pre mRNA splicing regulator female lethal(2)D [Hymenolepis microstoma]